MDYTKQVTINTTGVDLLEFTVDVLENANVKADADWYLFFNSVQGNGYKVLANSVVELSHRDYSNKAKMARKRVRILGLVSAGTTTAYVAYQGGGI